MIDYDELEQELLNMQPRQRLYELIKKHMQLRGRWKASGRGKPFSKGSDKRRNQLNK